MARRLSTIIVTMPLLAYLGFTQLVWPATQQSIAASRPAAAAVLVVFATAMCVGSGWAVGYLVDGLLYRRSRGNGVPLARVVDRRCR